MTKTMKTFARGDLVRPIHDGHFSIDFMSKQDMRVSKQDHFIFFCARKNGVTSFVDLFSLCLGRVIRVAVYNNAPVGMFFERVE